MLNSCMREGKMPEEWRTGVDSPCMEKKGRCSRPWKILRLRIVECEMGEKKEGFRRERGTGDGMFTLRQLVEKRKRYGGRDVHSETTGGKEKEVRGAGCSL